MERLSIPSFMLVILCFTTTELAHHGQSSIDNHIQSEREALADFKSGIKDPNNRLSSWKDDNYCYWQGITCENGSGFVISIDLHNPYPRENIYKNWNSMNLSGEIRPSLGKLKHLKYLDLSFNSFHVMSFPQFFGSLEKLVYLNLSSAGFNGKVPSNLQNLSNLQYLDLSTTRFDFEYSNNLHVEDIEWLMNLTSLKYLGMDLVDFTSIRSQWAKVLNNLQNLTELHLYFSQLNGPIPLGLGELPNLRYLDLTGNFYLQGNISQLLSKSWRKMEFLKLGGIGLYGSIPSSIGNLCNLKYLDLSHNALNGNLPESIGEHETCKGKSVLPNLMELFMEFNQLMGKVPDWFGEVKNLRILDLSNNQLEGSIPDSLCTLQHLEHMSLRGNYELNGSLPKSIGQLSQLKLLDVSFNHFNGSLSEEQFQNLTKLEFLNMGINSFYLDVSPNWVPPFQIQYLIMDSCHVGPSFPAWLQSQKNLRYLVLSDASISSPIPNWFWNMSLDFEGFDLSQNQLQGQLPNPLISSNGIAYISLSSNLLEGPIPSSIKGVYLLDLSQNKFSGALPSSIGEPMSNLSYLYLSSNQLTGVIPDSIGLLKSLVLIDLSENNFNGTIPESIAHLTSLQFIQFSRNNLAGGIPDSVGQLTSLEVIDFSMNNLIGSIPSFLNNFHGLVIIDLGHNNFSGEIPMSLGQLQWLQSLHLNNNKLSGELPSSFQNLTSLQVLDVSYNKLSGEVPTWIGSAFPNLVILNLRSNMFSGGLPSRLSNLSSLHVLDLSHNELTGEIAVTLGEQKSMAQNNIAVYPLYDDSQSNFYEERLVLNSKGQSLEYTRTLSLVVAIDLSHNNLSGGFPQGITKLSGLVVLNLSRNHITGQIPRSISMLRQLSSLDLSSNELSGTIPSSMDALTFLGYLNLSYNKFSGKIPFMGQMTTFNELAFVGNPDLCGPPLAIKCQDHEDSDRRQPVDNKDDDNDDGGDDDSFVDQWFYLSNGLGFSMGVLVLCFVLIISKSWCKAYFDFVGGIVKWLLRGRTTYTIDTPSERVGFYL